MRWGCLFICLLLPLGLTYGQTPASGGKSTALSSSAAMLGTPRAIPNGSLGLTSRGIAPDEDPMVGSSSRSPKSTSPAASLGALSVGKPVSGMTLGPVDDSPEEAYNWGTVTKPWKTTSKVKDSYAESRSSGIFQRTARESGADDGIGGGSGLGGSRFASEADFPNFISPTSNPFLAEDPRKLTELRTIFFYQTIPGTQYLYRGGNLQTFVLQGRLGVTENLSVVVHKLGVTLINPGGLSLLDNEAGITEFWFGPKYTFYRDCDSGTIAAGGLILQLPIGPKSIFQDTGNFGVVPYLTAAQKFGRSSFGQFTVLDTIGYNFGTGKERSDFFYNTLHLDYDIASLGRFFPFVELNYFRYTSNGRGRPNLFFEGRDLANVGASLEGRNFLTSAIGMRFKLNQGLEFGFAGEFPLNGTRDLLDFRFGVDFIFRF